MSMVPVTAGRGGAAAAAQEVGAAACRQARPVCSPPAQQASATRGLGLRAGSGGMRREPGEQLEECGSGFLQRVMEKLRDAVGKPQ